MPQMTGTVELAQYVSAAALDEHVRVDLRADVTTARDVGPHTRGVLARAA